MKGLLTITAALLLTGACGLTTSATSETVVIGVDLPLSGTYADLGTVYHDALELRARQLNEQQAAGQGVRIELAVLDNHSDDAVATANVAELAADTQVAAIITAGCVPCLVEASLNGLSVPTMSLDPQDVMEATPQRQWLFRLGPDAGDNADRLSQEMARTGVETVGLVHTTDMYGLAGDLEVSDATALDDIDVVIRQRLVPTADEDTVAGAAEQIAGWQPEPQFPGQFPPADAAGTGPDAVVLWTAPAHAAALAAELRQAGYDGELYLDMLAVNDIFSDVDEFHPATVVTTAAVDPPIASSPAVAARREWFSSYLTAFGTYHLHSALAADALSALAQAISRTDLSDPVREQVRGRLENVNLDGISGSIRFTPDQHSGLHPVSLTLMTAAGDRWR